VVHFENGQYMLWIDNLSFNVTESTLANVISSKIPTGSTIRLLSCSDLASATEVSSELGSKVIASEEAVKLYADGSVETGQFYEIKPDGTRTKVENSTPVKSSTIREEFILLGRDFLPKGAEITEFPKNMLFGQHRIAPNFSSSGEVPESLAGKSIFDVAEMIKTGTVPLDDFLIRYTKLEDGRLITLNNRGLATLTMAGKVPTHAVFVPLEEVSSYLLEDISKTHEIFKTKAGINTIRVTEQKSGLGLLKTIIRNN
jgi:hypothetical protein